MKLIIFVKIFIIKNLLIFLAIHLLSNCTTAQPIFNIQSFTTDDGLPTNFIYNIDEDKDGFIWAMSNAGLTRFDGVKFENFKYHNCNEGKFYDFQQSTYKIKRAGIEGFLFFNKSKNCIEKITRNDNIYFDTESKIIYKDSSNTWLCKSDRKTILKYNNLNFKIIDSIHVSNLISAHPIAIFNGNIYFGTSDNNYFIEYNIASKQEKQISFKKYLSKGVGITTHNFLRYKKKLITGSWGNGLMVYYPENKSLSNFVTKQYDCFRDITYAEKLTGDSIIWCADAFRGISLFDIKNEKFVQHISIGETLNHIKSNNIYDLFSDSRGNLWIASQSGLALINPHKQNFFIKDFKNRLPANYSSYNFTTNIFQYQALGKKIVFRTAQNEILLLNVSFSKVEKKIQFNHNAIYFSDINNNHNGRYKNYFFIGDRDTLHYINLLNNHYEKIYLDLNSNIPNRFIQIIKYYGADTLWIGTNVGLYKFDLREKKVISSFTIFNGLEDNDINDILLKDNELYVTSNNGIYIINCSNNKLKKVRITKYPDDDIIMNFQLSNNGDIWANYLHKGFLRINEKNNFAELFSLESTKNNLSIYSFHIDSLDRFWLLTDIGLLCYDYRTHKLKAFTESDGLPKYNYFILSKFFYIDNQYVGITGIGSKYVIFQPNKIRFDTAQLILKIIQISNIGENIPFNSDELLSLKYNQNSLNLLLSAKNFNAGKSLNARYRLVSKDTNWIKLDATNSIFFPKLEPGMYQLEMQVSNYEDFENIKSSYFKFQIKPPLWNTWFAYLIYFILVSFFLFKIYTIIINQKNMKIKNQELIMEHENQLKLERNRIASEMHDDIGGGLSTIKFLSELARKSNSENDKNVKLEKIALTSKDLIENMGDIIWAMNIQNDNIESLIAQIRSFASEFAENNNLKLKLELTNCSNNFIINGVKRRNIYLCIKEVFHNIKKHSNAQNVHLSIDIQRDMKIKIIDDGVFFNLNTVKLGNGIMNMRQRMSSIGGKLQIKFEGGTLIEFEIPI